jgi:hypothetical protein
MLTAKAAIATEDFAAMKKGCGVLWPTCAAEDA